VRIFFSQCDNKNIRKENKNVKFELNGFLSQKKILCN